MSPAALAIVTFVCLFAAGLFGMWLHRHVPEAHLRDDSRHLLETGLGVIGTVAGLVLGLVVASSFGTFLTQRSAVTTIAAKILLLDRSLAVYGPQAQGSRVLLKATTQDIIDQIWSANGSPQIAPKAGNRFFDAVVGLQPANDLQKTAKGEAVSLALDIAQQRALMYEQLVTPPSLPLEVMLIFWFAVTFLGLGLFTDANRTVISALFLCAVAVAGAVFLIQDMYQPFHGLVRVSDEPLRAALANLGR